MKSRLIAVASALVVTGAVAAPAAHADASTTVVLSQVAFRGPNGGNDEMIQIRNVSSVAQDIGGWKIVGTNAAGTNSTRATVPVGTSLPASRSFLFVNGAAGGYGDTTVPGDVVYTTGITDTGGVQLRTAADVVVDAVGHTGLTATAPLFKEGDGLPFPGTTPASNATAFKRTSEPDTDRNQIDFTGPQVRTPENCAAACAIADPCPAGAEGITDITTIQKTDAPCEGRTVKVRGIVTGIDDLYGSNFENIFRSDSGLWLQQATRPQDATSSSGIFIAGIRRDAGNPGGVIGSDATINGRVETKFGLVQIVPPGVGTTNQNAQLVDLTTTPTAVGVINSAGNPLPEPITLERGRSETQDVATRDYYRSLQGMRVRLPEAIATGGGTTKFRDVFVEPGTTATRLFRKNDLAAITTPWSDARAELGISGEAGAKNPADPRVPWHSSTQVDLDLFDVVREVVGPLTFSFSYYKIMPQPGGPAPAIERGPIHAAAPPTAPPAPAGSLRVASFNVENLFPIGSSNDGQEIDEDEYKRRVDALVLAIRDRLREPDVIAVQEVAIVDGANALTGLAQALGNYTGYIQPNNDERGIATGFLVKNGTTASNGRLLDADVMYNDRSEGVCDLAGGKLFDRAPYALDLKKGDIAFTAMSNHFASQSHENACRVAESEAVRRQTVALQQAGKNVLVAGDLNDFEFSAALARLTQGNTLTNLWHSAPQGLAYSYKFNGHLQTLDHILVTAGMFSRLTDMRYVHFDNDVYERTTTNAQGELISVDGTGISDHDPPLATFELRGASTSTPVDVTGNVPATLSLTLGTQAASLGTFTPGVAQDYTTTMAATVTSTGEDTSLSVLDPSASHTGRLTNGAYSLASPLEVRANTAAFAPLRGDNGPLTLMSWPQPVTAANVTLGFKQSIGATESLRTGAYGKTLTFTLSTTTP